MAKDNVRPPENEGADQDTDELLSDHPEQAPDESRISVEKVRGLDRESIRRRADTGDIVEDTVDDPPVPELDFSRNEDFSGDQASLSTDADYSRGSGWLGGKLWGEEAQDLQSGEETPPENADPRGFDPSRNQLRNLEAINREIRDDADAADMDMPPEVTPQGKNRGGPTGDLRDQGRDLGHREQVTALQAFGRDIGSAGLPGIEEGRDDEEALRKAHARHNPDWTAVLGKLGGSSPGSEENLQLAGKFQFVKFPASPEEVLQKLPHGAEFRIRSVTVNLHEAVAECHSHVFRSMFDIIDCVKDAIRRAEKLDQHPV